MKTFHSLPVRHCQLCQNEESRTIIGNKVYSNMYEDTGFCKDCFSLFLGEETEKRKKKKK